MCWQASALIVVGWFCPSFAGIGVDPVSRTL
jgi:hypothetical protein